MTVQKDVTKNIYVGNGSTRTFPFTFECPAEHPEYIKVYLMQDDGTALATSDYQLDMDARQITYPSSGTALPEGKKLVIMRELPLQQMMNLVNNGPYFAEDIETAFDENVMAMQQIAEKLNRSIIMSVDIDGDAFVNEVPFEAGKSFRIADDGKSIVLTEDPARVLPTVQNLATAAETSAKQARFNAESAANHVRAAERESRNAEKYAEKAKDISENVNVFVPAVDAGGTLTWTNKAGLANPAAVNIKGPQGVQGKKGDPGTGITIKGKYDSLSALQAAHPKADEGDAYMAGTNLYVWNGSAWIDCGNVQGPKGEKGEKGDTGSQGPQGVQGLQGLQGPAGNAATITIGSVTTSAPGTSAQVTNRGTSSAAVLDFVLPKGKDGADGGVTVDENLSTTSTNPLQNRAVYDLAQSILSRIKGVSDSIPTKVSALENDAGYVKTVNNTAPDESGNVNITVSGGGSNITVDDTLTATSTNAIQSKAVYAALDKKLDKNGTAAYAYRDSSGYIIYETYAKKTDVSGMVKSVNNTKPDTNGNVNITVSGGGSNVTVDTTLSSSSTNAIANKAVYMALNEKLGKLDTAVAATAATRALQDGDGNTISLTYVKTVNNTKPDSNGNVNISTSSGGGVSTSTQNTWTAQQSFDLALLGVEKYTTAYTNGNSVKPSSVTAVYNATGSFTLDLANFSFLLSIGQSLVFTAYIKANADYPLTITNAGTLKYIGGASDVAITSAGLLLNIFITLDNSGNKTSIVQASKLS